MPKAANVRASKPLNAQPAFTLKAVPKVSKAKAKALPTSEDIAKLQALAQAGLLSGLNVSAAAADGGFNIADLLKAYEAIRGLWGLIQGQFKKDTKPVEVPDAPAAPPSQDEIDGPAERTVGRLEAKVFWVSRKKTPHKAGGGRYLLSDEGKQKIVSGSDPLQAGDRVCFDVSPYDTEGVKYEGPKPLVLEHRVGGVGEIQQQEENDYTPVVLAPWEGESGQPGFHGEITYQAAGGGFESKVIRLRVRPWA